MGLFNDKGELVQEGVGEICLSGSQVTEGYWNAPDITAERFFEAEGRRWYRTGDLGRYVPGEGYAYLGRADRQVKIRVIGWNCRKSRMQCGRSPIAISAVIPWPLDDSGAALGCAAFIVGGSAANSCGTAARSSA